MHGTLVRILNVDFNSRCGDGTIARGHLVEENITVAEIIISSVLVSIATDIATDNGIFDISGLLECGYPAITSAIIATMGASIS
jgi:hypothetical protein